jgi:hypothetical protein
MTWNACSYEWSSVQSWIMKGRTPVKFIAPTQRVAYFSLRRSVISAPSVGSMPIPITRMVGRVNSPITPRIMKKMTRVAALLAELALMSTNVGPVDAREAGRRPCL